MKASVAMRSHNSPTTPEVLEASKHFIGASVSRLTDGHTIHTFGHRDAKI